MSEPLFGEADQPERERSLRDQDKDAQVAWRKYTGRATPCWVCSTARWNTGTGGVAAARHIRQEGDDVQYLCGPHAAEAKTKEELAEVNSRRKPKEVEGVKRPFNPHTYTRKTPGHPGVRKRNV